MAYTYLIGWKNENRWYYGVRYSRNSDPADLWVSYFTSSKLVKAYRKEYGEPDVIQIRKVFSDSAKARLWESKVLRKMNAVRDDRFLNQSYSNGSFFAGPEHLAKLHRSKVGTKHTEESREKMSLAAVGRPKSDTHRKAIAKALTGKSRPEEVREKIRDTRAARQIVSTTDHMNVKNYTCEKCGITTNKGNFMRWHQH